MKQGEQIGWGLIYGLFPCKILIDFESSPQPIAPELMGGMIVGTLFSVVAFMYCTVLVGLYNFLNEDNKIEPMFAIWLSPKTRKRVEKL